jgi:hypothetical protein
VLEALWRDIRATVPGAQLRFKDQSAVQRGVGRVVGVLGNRRYTTGFVTVLGRTVWWPDQAAYARVPERTARILLHEWVHLSDWARQPLWFPVSYALALPTVWTWRAHWERRAFNVDICAYKRMGLHRDQVSASLRSTFCGPEYGYMQPRPDQIDAWVGSVWDRGIPRTAPGDDALYGAIEGWLERLTSPGGTAAGRA